MLRSVENSRRESTTSIPPGPVFSTPCCSDTHAFRPPSRTLTTRSTASSAPAWPAKDIYVDRTSGAKASRPELDRVLRMLRGGDTLKITRLDRLGRSVLHLVTLGAELRERGVGLHVTEQGIDTTTAEGRAMFGMLSVLAELQRS
jgi:DNA invertase Pin-like site-specific DNA recombinase